MILLYATIWIALSLLVIAEIGRPARWARAAWVAGGVLAAVHALLALAIRYHWDHETAVVETARQGAALYGFTWRGSIYVNYAFLLLWLTVGWTWRHWLWRAFVLTMMINGAIVFARPAARPAGVVLVLALAGAWWRARL